MRITIDGAILLDVHTDEVFQNFVEWLVNENPHEYREVHLLMPEDSPWKYVATCPGLSLAFGVKQFMCGVDEIMWCDKCAEWQLDSLVSYNEDKERSFCDNCGDNDDDDPCLTDWERNQLW